MKLDNSSRAFWQKVRGHSTGPNEIPPRPGHSDNEAANGKPSGQPVDVLTGFVNGDDEALGRPVGVAVDRKGALFVADDVGNTVWRVAPASGNTAMR